MSSLTTLFTSIANAIRAKKGTSATIVASDFPTEIASIPTGTTPTGTIPITTNGTHDVTNYAIADVSVTAPAPNLQSKSETIQTNTTTTITADNGYDGLSSVEIITNVSGGGSSFSITNGNYLFYDDARLDVVSNLLALINGLTTAKYMFASIKTSGTTLNLSNLNTSQTTDMSYMFASASGIDQLDVSNFNTGNVTTMQNTFNSMSNLTTINVSGFDVKKVTTMQGMFASCKKLASLDLSSWTWTDTLADIKLTTIQNFLNTCSVLATLALGTFRCDKVTNVSQALGSSSGALAQLTTITGSLYNLGRGYTSSTVNYSNYKVDVSNSPLLTHDSLMNIINGLYDLNLTYNVAGGGTLKTQSLNMGATNMAKLSSSEIAVATAKGWTVS